MSDVHISTENTEGIISCPYCHDTVPSLVKIEAGMRLRLQQNAKVSTVPETVCDGCYAMLSKLVSKGAALRAEAAAKEQNRLMLWRNRVGLIKQAKMNLAHKNFAEAAVSFEKYLRVLEIVHDLKPGGLKPELFRGASKSQELTVITSVYWDLMRVYDTSSNYADRQTKAAEKLAEFARFTPIYGHIMRKAETQSRIAKNQGAYRHFLKLSNAKRPRCFIATSAFDSYTDETVLALCDLRDRRLKRSHLGRKFIYLYYRLSPHLARHLDRHEALKPAARLILRQAARLCRLSAAKTS
jgi:hypothetical protein